MVELERKVRALEQEKTLETTEGTLVNLRRYLNRPNSAFDRFEVLDILQALVRLARTQAHQKAEEYAAALDEVRARWDSLSSPELQRLLLGLLGDPKLYRQQRMQELPLQQVPAGQTVVQPGVVIMPQQAQGGQQTAFQPSVHPGQHVVQYPEQRPPPFYTPHP